MDKQKFFNKIEEIRVYVNDMEWIGPYNNLSKDDAKEYAEDFNKVLKLLNDLNDLVKGEEI